MGFYERQFGGEEKRRQQEQDRRGVDEPCFGPIRSNLFRLFIDNFKMVLFFLPAVFTLYFGLALGHFGVLLLAVALLIPAGPAVAAMYDVCYQIVRQVPKHEMRPFFASYRANLRQGMATMALLVPFLGALLLSLLVTAQRPVWVIVSLLLGGWLLLCFAVYAFSQVALVALPLTSIWKNAVYLIVLGGWKGALVGAAHLAALAVLYRYMVWASFLFVFLGPALLAAWSAKLLFPRLREVLLREG